MSGPWEQYAQQPDFGAHLDAEAQRLGVPVQMARAVMRQESGGRADAVSPKGARGPMQLMPGTAAELGVDPNDPYQNITGGLTYLKQQLDDFGDPQLALAAYNAGPGAVRKYGGVPPYAETQNYVQAIAGPAQAEGPWSQYGQAPEMAVEETMPETPVVEVNRSTHPDHLAWQAKRQIGELPTKKPPAKADQGLGFQKGAFKALDNAAVWAESGLERLGVPVDRIADFLGSPTAREAVDARAAAVEQASREGRVPGKIGEFAGNVLGTLPTAALPGGVIPQGMAGGALLSEAKDAGGVVRDAAIGGLTSAGAAIGLGALGDVVSKGLSKAPKILGLAELRTAKKAAYDKVANLGGLYTGKAKADLLKTVETNLLGDGLDQGANPGAWAALQRAKTVLSGKKPVSLSDLDNLRQAAWRQAAGLKGPDKEAERYYGQKIIDMIDDFVDTATPTKVLKGNAAELSSAIREARKANQTFRKYETVANQLESADLRAASAYTGTNLDNTIRQKMRPMLDKTSNQRMRGLSKDEEKALKRVVTGTTGQNALRTAGQLVDPRKMLGMGLQGAAGLSTGGLSLATAPLGMLGTALANRAGQKNVQGLLDVIAAGGSRQALAKAPTASSRAVQRAVQAARPAVPAASVAALPRKKDQRRP